MDRPCKKHKETGIECTSCGDYQSIGPSGKSKILIIKLGAMGDVLRTTFLAKGLKEHFSSSSITWIVAKGSEAILQGNPNISRIWSFDTAIFSKLVSEKFELIINLDLSPESLSLATISNAHKKLGYWLDGDRKIVCSGMDAARWLEMSGSDAEKKKNRKTYQYWMSKIVGLPRADYEIYVPLLKSSLKKANAFARKHGLKNKTVIGINPGAGGRWKMKKWKNSGFIDIIKRLDKKNTKVLLFGGCEEKKLLEYITRKSAGKALNTGSDNSLNDFFALLNLCDIVLCGDTLALHAALGLKKKVLALFGPTSAAEIEMYGRGLKLVSPKECVCCYRPECDIKPKCMDVLDPSVVWEALKKLMTE